jgi:hypothetical protein
MDDLVRMAMRNIFDLLDGEQSDDVESQFENLQVLWDRVEDELVETAHTVHSPAIELHYGRIAHMIEDGIKVLLDEGTPHKIRWLLYDVVKCSVLFGREIGKVNWPLPKVPCEELHSR